MGRARTSRRDWLSEEADGGVGGVAVVRSQPNFWRQRQAPPAAQPIRDKGRMAVAGLKSAYMPLSFTVHSSKKHILDIFKEL
jgi:hypothetical protein